MDLAFDGLNDAREAQTSGQTSPADGQYLYQHALEIQEFAASEYLRLFADLKAAISLIPHFDSNGDGSPAGQSGEKRSGVELLSKREIEVLTLIASGKSGREIAELLGISFKTVTVHRQNIYSKLKIRKTAELVRIAMRMGLIDP